MDIPRIVQECKALLDGHYGEQLKGLILYGSVARDRADADSDIDLLVLLSEPFSYFDEVRRIVDLLYPIQLESQWLISAKPVAANEFECGRLLLYRNAKREGVMV